MKKTELDNNFYNNAYLSKGKYQWSYEDSPYFNMWSKIIPRIDNIADFGCGVGQFAEMVVASGKLYSYGVDFSEVAIERCKELGHTFYCDNLYNDVYDLHEYDMAVILETLEHVEDDLLILSKIPKGKKVILSVPNFDSVGHVRFFANIQEVLDRYSKCLSITDIQSYPVGKGGNTIFVVYGNK